MKKFLVCFVLLATCLSEDPCNSLLHQWITGIEKLPPIVYMASGKFLNDLGDFNHCNFNNPEYVYFTMQVFDKLASNFQFMGLCAPMQCKDQIASNNYSQMIQDEMNNATGLNYSVFSHLKFYNPQTEQPQMDWSNYLVIALLVFLVGVGIAGSFIDKILPEENLLVKVVKSFSLYDNFKKIITISPPGENDNLLFLNGMRVMSIFWIVFGHDIWFRFMNIKNWTEGFKILTTPGIPTLAPAAYFAVDSFFWIGGFLVTMGILEQLKKVKNFAKFYAGAVLHRFIRIWPTYMLAILMFWKVAPYLGDGPIWRNYAALANNCSGTGILWNMFFIDNFEDHGPSGMDYCFGWGWYLAVDFQLFLITPFLLLAYHKNKVLGWLITFALFLGSVLTAFFLIFVNDWRYPIFNPNFPPQPSFMDKFYYKPYVRASAYLMGMFSAFIYLEWKQDNIRVVRVVERIKNSIPIRTLFYLIGISLISFVIWIIVPYQTGSVVWSSLAQAFYNSLNRVVFLFGVYLCIFAAMFGCKNDPVHQVLAHPIFSPLAKVSFCIYLTHFIIIMTGVYSAKMDLFWQPTSSLYIYLSDLSSAICLATFLSLLVEAPILGLEKIFLRPAKSNKPIENSGGALGEKLINDKMEGISNKKIHFSDAANLSIDASAKDTLL